jgi:hypothetical protein
MLLLPLPLPSFMTPYWSSSKPDDDGGDDDDDKGLPSSTSLGRTMTACWAWQHAILQSGRTAKQGRRRDEGGNDESRAR